MDFYKSLNYSFGNEDWHVEKKALQVAPKDHVLCVTASGDRPLHLLLTDCEKVVTIDVNQSQTYLLALKIAVFQHFDYEKTLAFLGCTPAHNRLMMFQELKSALHPEIYAFWQKHKAKIKKGIIFQGKTEQLCLLASKFIKVLRPRTTKQLFAFTDVHAQREFVDKVWDTWGFKKTFEVLVHPRIFKLLSNDPGVTGFTEYVKHPGLYIYDRMLSYLRHHLANQSALLQLLFQGNVQPTAYLPYLTPGGYHTIRNRLHKIEWQTGNIIQYLSDCQGPVFNCFSMSDIASYMPQSAFEKLVFGMHHSAHPGARFCVRELISKRHFPQNIAHYFHRDPDLENTLEQEESNFVYRFMAGKISKS